MQLFIFHVDGVLRSAAPATHAGLVKAFSHAGLPFRFTEKDLRTVRGFPQFQRMEDCIAVFYALHKQGMRFANIDRKLMERQLAALVVNHGTPEDLQIITKIVDAYKAFMNSEAAAPLFGLTPTAKAVVAQLKAGGFKMAAWTGGAEGVIRNDLQNLGMEHFECILGNEAGSAKDAAEKICSMLTIPKEEAAFVGDSVADVRQAKEAGIKSFVILSSAGDEQIVRFARADTYFIDLLSLANQYAPAATPTVVAPVEEEVLEDPTPVEKPAEETAAPAEE